MTHLGRLERHTGDALTGLVWSNDRQVRRVEYAELFDNCECPRTEIMVMEVE